MILKRTQLAAGAAVMLAGSAALAQINITDFQVDDSVKGKVKITVAAEGSENVKIGSYAVRLSNVTPAPHNLESLKLAGLTFSSSGYYYVYSTDFGKPDPFLKDNGQKDEDPREGVFSITLDGTQWPEGRYQFSIAAMNRPASGAYYDSARPVFLTVGNPDLTPAKSNLEDAQTVVLYQSKDVYASFPSLTETADGRYFTTFGTKVRVSHIDPTGGNKQMVSSDGGLTWEDSSEKPINPAWRTKEGTLVRAAADGWIYVPISKKDELDKDQKITMLANDKQVAYLGGAHYQVSTDDGRTWTKHEIELPDDIAGLMNHHLHATETVTKNGVRLVAVYGRRKGHTRDEEFILRSADDGRTWSFVEVTPNGFSQPNFGINESALASLPNGDVLMMSRPDPANSVLGNLYSSISHDDGLTWSTPEKTDIWGYPPDLLVLPDGRILCAYGYRRTPMGIRASISYDNGKTWDVKNEMIIRADGIAAAGGDLGYPLIALRPDGRVMCVYYIATDGGMPHVDATVFSLPVNK
ncbi:MAG: exo-alpha-sialidase [Phycisphaerales bacterium]|nr:exo-alpha-sialidase [Phycisphaerales bacterium]